MPEIYLDPAVRWEMWNGRSWAIVPEGHDTSIDLSIQYRRAGGTPATHGMPPLPAPAAPNVWFGADDKIKRGDPKDFTQDQMVEHGRSCYEAGARSAAMPAANVPAAERSPIDANDLERMAKERPNDCFLKGSGVLKLTGAIRLLEAQIRQLRADGAKHLEPVGGFRQNDYGGWQQVASEYENDPDVTILYRDQGAAPKATQGPDGS